MTAVLYRTARQEELPVMVEWAAAEGWNPGLDDAPAFLAADAGGFFVAERDGVPLACISVVNHSDDFAFLGFYICRPEYRGQGIGFALWQHALDHAGARTVGLDGVADQEANYARSGFVRTGASVRMQGALTAQADPQVRLADTSDVQDLLALDSQANGINRPAFMSAWLTGAGTRKTVVLEENGGLTGFATLRRCRDGVKLGPVIAPDTASAMRLVRAGLTVLGSDLVIIDVPSENTALMAHLAELGFAETFATARMYRGPAPQRTPALQAIATMELG